MKMETRASSSGAGLAAALVAVVLLAGCASATPDVAATAAPDEAVASAAAPRPEITEISRLDVREGAPGTRIDIGSNAPLVWTTYRDADGNLVVELPNSRPIQGLAGQSLDSGLVSEVRVDQVGSADRPLTRLVILTREDAEHALAAQGGHLSVDLTPVHASSDMVAEAPVEPVAPVTSYAEPSEEATASVEEAEPAVAEMAPEEAPAMAAPAPAEAWADLGTADNPRVAPEPSGRAATMLEGIEIVQDGSAPAIRVAGDGDFAFSTFRLENPDRFVIDLEGVVNVAPRGVWNLSGDAVARVRVSQFKQTPQPVSRVVFDLASPGQPRLDRDGDGLLVRFGDAVVESPGMTAEAVRWTPEPAPQEESLAVTEPTPAATYAQVPDDSVREAEPLPEPAAMPTEEASDVMAFAAETAAAAPTPKPAAAPAPTKVASVADFEAADVAADTAPGAPLAPAPGESQTVGGGKKQYVGEPISLSLKDADVKDVLRSFAKISGLNVVVQPGVRGTVTVELESVPWDQALDQILKINGLGYELDGNIMRIAPTSVLEQEARRAQTLAQAQALSVPLRTVVKRLSYSTAAQMSRILMSGSRTAGAGLLSQRGTVTIDARTNTLIIKELPTYIDTVIAVIETLDIPEPQVMIEARIVETTKRFSRSLGIQWQFDGVADTAHGNTTGLTFPNNVDATGGVNLLTGSNNGFINLGLGNILNTFTLDAELIAAESEGLINVLSAPKIATLNNEPATIQSGLQIPIQTVANNTVSVQFVNATLRLQVTPHVTAEGTVLMDINIQKREPQLAFAVVGATNAPIATKEAQTRVIVRDGGTTVIGGIYEVSTDQGQDRVPGLANIPLLGHLFKNKRRLDENKELLIFITPRVVKL
ncbi:MAG: type IV pilus secretin PilQ [Acidobacteria bacterium]|nr:type IV pilus secretin PilQ [Acidobacteriota bacterium]